MNQKLKDATKAIGNVVPKMEQELMDRIRKHQERIKNLPKHVFEIKEKQSPEFADSFAYDIFQYNGQTDRQTLTLVWKVPFRLTFVSNLIKKIHS